MLFREYCVSRISICLTNERVQSFNIIERRWWSRENYYLYRLYCCLLSTIVLPVNYSRDHHQIIMHTISLVFYDRGGGGRLDVLVRFKDKGYRVNYPRPWDQAGRRVTKL